MICRQGAKLAKARTSKAQTFQRKVLGSSGSELGELGALAANHLGLGGFLRSLRIRPLVTSIGTGGVSS